MPARLACETIVPFSFAIKALVEFTWYGNLSFAQKCCCIVPFNEAYALRHPEDKVLDKS